MTGSNEPQLTQPAAPSDPFPSGDFDDWASTYDRDVLRAGFPFDGYSEVLETTLRLAEARPGLSVLDLGIGTGNLSVLFARQGCQIYGTDFSPSMLEQAQRKLPQAVLVQADLRQSWPTALDRSFDRIVSAYVFHHFDLAQKVALLRRLAALLTPGGRMVIADLAFTTQLDLQAARQAAGSTWENEFYWNAEETLPELARAGLIAAFHPVSSYAGVFVIPKL